MLYRLSASNLIGSPRREIIQFGQAQARAAYVVQHRAQISVGPTQYCPPVSDWGEVSSDQGLTLLHLAPVLLTMPTWSPVDTNASVDTP